MSNRSIGLPLVTVVLVVALAGNVFGRQGVQMAPAAPLPDGPLVFDSSSRAPGGRALPGPKFRIVVTKGLVRPYALAFLPDGTLLITERPGRLRIVRDGRLDPQPIAGVPPVLESEYRGLNDVALHPRFVENRLVYLTYYKAKDGSATHAIATLARGRLDGQRLVDVQELLTTDTAVARTSAARVAFGRDGKLYMVIGIPLPANEPGVATMTDAQNPASLWGKVLRLNDDGSAPADNPFVGKVGYRPEIYAFGIRNAMGLIVHPVSGELWESENGPQGGDEINVIDAGRNYGWPVISYGRSYTGGLIGDSGPQQALPFADGMEQPWLVWSPSIAVAGMAFYMGDRFPAWKGNLFVAGLIGEQLQRVLINEKGEPTRRLALLSELGQRIREVRQGPDGLLYVLTDETAGALLRIEPVDAAPSSQ